MFGSNKGIIFTADAAVALSIFVASLFIFYSFFIASEPFGSNSATIYEKTDNYLYSADASGALSAGVYLYQKGNVSGSYSVFDSVRNQSEYPANMRVYLYGPGGLTKIYDNSLFNFTDKLLLRRYAIFSVERGLLSQGTYVNVTAPSTIAGNNINVTVSILNPTSGTVNLVLSVYNSSGSQIVWPLVPPSYVIPPGAMNVSFNVTIPPGSLSDQYYAKAITDSPTVQNGTGPFSVFTYGLVEMEVGE